MSRRAARSGPVSIFAALVFASAAVASALPSGCARGVPCTLNSDCIEGYCQDGLCRKNCVDAARDCPSGWTCNLNAQCEPPGATSSSSGSGGSGGGTTSSTSTGGGGTTSTSTTSTSTSTTSSSTSTTSSSTSTTGGPATKHELDLCASDGECVSPLICRAMFPAGQKRCTRACSSTGQCMTGTVCEPIGSEKYCAGDDTGRQCSVAQNCNFGCLGNDPSIAYCTKECVSGADCPNGYGCMLVQDQPPIRTCVRAEAACYSGDTSACIGPGFCDESPQLWVGGCTTACSSQLDCPQRAAGFAAWSCSGGMCRRPSDVFGPVEGGATPAQYVNNCQGQVINVCNDAQHIDFVNFAIPNPPAATCGASTTTDGAPGDSCVNSCRYQGGCTYGFSCVAVGGVGNGRIGLCLKSGGGEVGASCANDTQCVFGYCFNGKCSRDCTADGICPGGTMCVAGGGPAVEGQPFKRCQ